MSSIRLTCGCINGGHITGRGADGVGGGGGARCEVGVENVEGVEDHGAPCGAGDGWTGVTGALFHCWPQ